MKILLQIKKWLAIVQKLFKQVEPVVADIEQEVAKPTVKKAAKPKSKPKKTA